MPPIKPGSPATKASRRKEDASSKGTKNADSTPDVARSPKRSDADSASMSDVPKVNTAATNGGTSTPRSIRSWYGGMRPSSIKDVPASPKPSDKASINDDKQSITSKSRVRTDRPPTFYLSSGPSRATVASAATTNLNVASEGAAQLAGDGIETAPSRDTTEMPKITKASESTPELNQTPTTWMGWWGKSGSQGDLPSTNTSGGRKLDPAAAATPSKNRPLSDQTLGQRPSQMQGGAPEVAKPSPNLTPKSQTHLSTGSTDAGYRTWLGLWERNRTDAPTLAPEVGKSIAETGKSQGTTSDADKQKSAQDEKNPVASSQPNASDSGSYSGSWAFWSRSPSNPTKEDASSKGNVGQMAVAGSPSQSHPEAAIMGSQGRPEATIAARLGASTPDSASIRSQKSAPDRRPGNKTAPINGTDATPKIDRASQQQQALSDPANMLLPTLEQTFPSFDAPGIFQQLGRLIYGQGSNVRHVEMTKDPPRIKNALAIGIHGYFPVQIVQTIIGRPTGTSIKFADYAARAIHKHAKSHGYEPKQVEKIALEGEGRIEERLDILWKLLLNWIDKIRAADFILVACHSQGVPVAISLVAKLIGFGCVHNARIGICAMAGINLGPFIDYKSRFIGGSAGELFEFTRPDSQVSKAYESALATVVKNGAKVTYIGSLDDQLVSLQSSTFGTANHPHIYRAAWIDGRLHTPDFLTQLVGFSLKIRNLGISDHGLIRELSNSLAGSLVGGEGHSRLYEDPAVYDLALAFAVGSTVQSSSAFFIDKSTTSIMQNPYVLPFAMRGLLEEDLVRGQLSKEALELLRKFDEWKPTTKVLRDLKYRLEGVRSKL